MEAVSRFQIRALGLIVLATVGVAVAALTISPTAAQGVVVGGLSGAIALWLMARQMTRFPTLPKEAIAAHVYRSSFIRILLYGLALMVSFFMDTQAMFGLLGAVVGILITHVVLVLFGLAQAIVPKSNDSRTHSGRPRNS
ncbi:MAG: hypothetical protein AMXMBFR84_08740 [Candidatus Hydrogenedentota bacterium]